jgi:nucleotide-binding universal stress UspA family protein
VREIEAVILPKMGSLAYDMTAKDLETELAARVRAVNAYPPPKLVVAHGQSIYDTILGTAREAGVDLIIVGSPGRR